MNQEILLVSPIAALRALARLMGTPAFYAAVALSFGAMLLGFVLAALLGALLAVAAYRFPFVDGLLSPLLSAVKATPVASFIILALVWIGTRYLSVFAAFLMVLPLIYTSVLSGLRSTDAQLLEMAQVFEISLNRRARALYLPAAFPYFL
ncbi:MAG: ABC transporter permease subunit, partial [Eubacteriales bacterium]|nr:ABC transporter permease subunit [Eubacteriales bacterium]